jgi:hypothetical protein
MWDRGGGRSDGGAITKLRAAAPEQSLVDEMWVLDCGWMAAQPRAFKSLLFGAGSRLVYSSLVRIWLAGKATVKSCYF